jgi:hypothetical protein
LAAAFGVIQHLHRKERNGLEAAIDERMANSTECPPRHLQDRPDPLSTAFPQQAVKRLYATKRGWRRLSRLS